MDLREYDFIFLLGNLTHTAFSGSLDTKVILSFWDIFFDRRTFKLIIFRCPPE